MTKSKNQYMTQNLGNITQKMNSIVRNSEIMESLLHIKMNIYTYIQRVFFGGSISNTIEIEDILKFFKNVF